MVPPAAAHTRDTEDGAEAKRACLVLSLRHLNHPSAPPALQKRRNMHALFRVYRQEGLLVPGNIRSSSRRRIVMASSRRGLGTFARALR